MCICRRRRCDGGQTTYSEEHNRGPVPLFRFVNRNILSMPFSKVRWKRRRFKSAAECIRCAISREPRFHVTPTGIHSATGCVIHRRKTPYVPKKIYTLLRAPSRSPRYSSRSILRLDPRTDGTLLHVRNLRLSIPCRTSTVLILSISYSNRVPSYISCCQCHPSYYDNKYSYDTSK